MTDYRPLVVSCEWNECLVRSVVRVDETGTWIDQSVVPVAKDFLSDCLSVCL